MPAADFIFGTVGAPTSTPPKPGGSAGAVQQMKALGLGTLELGWVQSVNVTPATCALIAATATQHSLPLSVHAPYFINLNAKKEEWPNSRKRLMDAAHFGNLAGATDIIFHPGSYFERPQAALKLAIQRLEGCVRVLRKAGNPVTLRPELMGKSAMLGSLEDVLQMALQVPGVLPCLDIAHLHARGGDGSINTTAEFRDALQHMRTVLGAAALRNMHIHISGIAYGPTGEEKHLTFAEGDLRYRDFLKVLAELGCSGRMLVESPIMETDALHLQRVWRRINRV
jgi:deoxyribonuclease-4